MQTKNNPSEYGQVIVLIVLAMIALLGFTALAVDGSMVYSDRRWAQNVADSAALAGAGAAAQYIENQEFVWTVDTPWGGVNNSCPTEISAAITQGIAEAINRAADNDYNLSYGITPDFGGLEFDCVMEYPNPFLDVTVVVKDTTEIAFAQVVFPDGLENTTTAVARVRPAMSMGYGRTIVALNPHTCQGQQHGMGLTGLGGNSNNLTVNGGGAWSNGCMRVDNQTPNVIINNGSADYFDTTYTANSVPTVNNITFVGGSANPQTDVEIRMRSSEYTPSIEDCNKDENRYTPRELLPPINRNLPQVWHLDPGLYCIVQGSRPQDRTLNISNGMVVTGDMVTIVLLEVPLAITAGANVTLSAPDFDDDPNAYGDAIPGLLFYAPPSNAGCSGNQLCMDFDGNAVTNLAGTILAPGDWERDPPVTATIRYTGNNSSSLLGSIIGYNLIVGGSSGTSVTYDPNNTARVPTKLSMKK